MANKKGFAGVVENPATASVHEKLLGIVKPDAEPVKIEQPKGTAVKKIKETKSKRLQLLIYPSVYEACKKESDLTGESVNEIINEILKKHFEKE